MRSARKSTACCVDRRALRLGERRAVEAGLAVDVGGDEELARERAVGAGRHRHVAAADELEHAERVRRRLLERLVAGDRRDAEEVELRAGEREQERDRVVVARVAVEQDRRRIVIRRASICVDLRRGGQRRLRAGAGRRRSPRRAGRGAGALLPRSRPSSSETTRQAVKASPAAVPSTASTGGGAARATSSPSSRRSAPSAPSVSAKSAPIGLDPSASSSSELATIRSARSSMVLEHRPRRRGVQAEEAVRLLGARPRSARRGSRAGR